MSVNHRRRFRQRCCGVWGSARFHFSWSMRPNVTWSQSIWNWNWKTTPNRNWSIKSKSKSLSVLILKLSRQLPLLFITKQRCLKVPDGRKNSLFNFKMVFQHFSQKPAGKLHNSSTTTARISQDSQEWRTLSHFLKINLWYILYLLQHTLSSSAGCGHEEFTACILRTLG